MSLPGEIKHKLRLWAAKGGKTHRRRTLARIEQFVTWCGVRHPAQIGKKHVHQYLQQFEAPTTRRDHWYAIRQLWKIIGRGDPPGKP